MVYSHFLLRCVLLALMAALTHGDSLIKPIRVEANGFLREKTWTKYICSNDLVTGEDSLDSWELSTLDGFVEGSARAWVTAEGDLSLSLVNFERLIQEPIGCGEQNMIKFISNTFLVQYLKATNQTTPDTTRKLTTYMKTGYERELVTCRPVSFSLDDGSFGAINSSSTWLTASFLKIFTTAKEFIPIDKNDLNKTSSWFQSIQREDGCFNNLGVFNTDMRRGLNESDSIVPLTAFVMTALLEANNRSCSSSCCLAAQCLQADSSQDPYIMALKAYAFALAGLPEAETALQKLLEEAVVTKNLTYWVLTKGPDSANTRGVAVETAGYAILAMMRLHPQQYEQQARKVVRWIIAERNRLGEFDSTQDTMVALQALALFETHSYQGPLKVVATVRATGLVHPFTVTDDNKLLQQLVRLPTLPTTVTITMDGHGCLVLQIHVKNSRAALSCEE